MTEPNPTPPITPRAAAERIVELDDKAAPSPWVIQGTVHDHDIVSREDEDDEAKVVWAEDDHLCGHMADKRFIAESRTLAPILARAWEEAHPRLVWKSKALLGELPGEDLFQWRDGEDRGVTLGWEMNLWEADVEIACLASNGQPWPVKLLEVQEP